jgi:hypothetical protein
MWSVFHGKWDVTIDGQSHTIEAHIYYIFFYPELNVVIDKKLVYERNPFPLRRLQLLVWTPGKQLGRFEQFGREFVIAKKNALFSRRLMLFIDGRNAERITEF